MPVHRVPAFFISNSIMNKTRWLLFGFLLLCLQTAFSQSGGLIERRGIVVGPVDRSQLESLVDGGTIETEGYSDIVLNMAGMPSAANRKTGVVGAILIPDIQPFDEAFHKWGILPAVIELTADVKAGDTHFLARQKRFDVGFPR